MMLQMVVAADLNNAIGIDNKLPWHLPNDLAFFKKVTLGYPIIMGRKTFQSIGKALPGRKNIVISRDLHFTAANIHCHRSLESAIELLTQEHTACASIIGGGEIFKIGLPLSERIYLTRVYTKIVGASTFFPTLPIDEWHCVWQEKHLADQKHLYPYDFEKWERKNSGTGTK